MRKLKLILVLAMAATPAPALAATSSADLDTLALQLEQSGSSTTLNAKLLSLLREPALTLEGRTLPSTAASYTLHVETAWKLMPGGFIPMVWQHAPPQPNCSAMIAYWDTGPVGGLKMETFAWGAGNCAAVSSAAIARGWAWKLRQVNR